MPSVILPCYVHNAATYRRIRRWINYMDRFIKPRLGYDRIILLDNNSDLKFLKKLEATIHTEDNECLHVGRSDLFVYRYHTHYARTDHLVYPYWWRAVYQLPKFKDTFYQSDKYYWIDSDVYIVRPEFIEYIKGQNSGLIRYTDRTHKWGETIIMTINKDSFHLLTEDEQRTEGWFRNEVAEITMPKTLIDSSFLGGRFPEQGLKQTDDMYWIGQCDQANWKYKVKWMNGKEDSTDKK